MGVHIRQITRARDTTDTYVLCQLNLRAINHTNQYDTDPRIHYIDQLVRFDYGTATTNVVTTFVNINGQILRISRKHSI